MAAHQRPGVLLGLAVAAQPRLPAPVPVAELVVLERLARRRGAADQIAEGVGVVGVVAGHPVEQVGGQGGVAVLLAEQPQFAAHHHQPALRVALGVAFDQRLRRFHGAVGVVVDQRNQGFREARQVPLGDHRLVAVGVAAALIDGAEHGLRMVAVHEGAGAVVDGLAGQGHVVGVHHAVDKAHPHPFGDQCDLPVHHPFQQRQRRHLGARPVRVVALEGVVHQRFQQRRVLAAGGVLKGAHAQVRGRHPGEDGAGLGGVAQHLLAGADHRQRPGGGHAQGVHRLADDVLAQHRAESGAAVAAAGKRRAPGALELDVAALVVRGELLAEQHRAAVAEHGRVAELVAGVGLGQRLAAGQRPVAAQQGGAGVAVQGFGVEPQLRRELAVEQQQLRRPHRLRVTERKQGLGQAGVAVVEPEAERVGGHAGAP